MKQGSITRERLKEEGICLNQEQYDELAILDVCADKYTAYEILRLLKVLGLFPAKPHITELEKKVAELEKGPGRPEVAVMCRVKPLQPSNLDWVDKLSSVIAAATSGASHDTP